MSCNKLVRFVFVLVVGRWREHIVVAFQRIGLCIVTDLCFMFFIFLLVSIGDVIIDSVSAASKNSQYLYTFVDETWRNGVVSGMGMWTFVVVLFHMLVVLRSITCQYRSTDEYTCLCNLHTWSYCVSLVVFWCFTWSILTLFPLFQWW